jgi:hypothetical protein
VSPGFVVVSKQPSPSALGALAETKVKESPAAKRCVNCIFSDSLFKIDEEGIG